MLMIEVAKSRFLIMFAIVQGNRSSSLTLVISALDAADRVLESEPGVQPLKIPTPVGVHSELETIGVSLAVLLRSHEGHFVVPQQDVADVISHPLPLSGPLLVDAGFLIIQAGLELLPDGGAELCESWHRFRGWALRCLPGGVEHEQSLDGGSSNLSGEEESASQGNLQGSFPFGGELPDFLIRQPLPLLRRPQRTGRQH